MRRWLSCLAVALLVAGCASEKELGRTEEVTADDFGSEWPLTVDSALLTCDPSGDTLIQIGGHAYGLGGISDEEVHPNFEKIWARDPAQGGAHRDLSPLVEEAQALCE